MNTKNGQQKIKRTKAQVKVSNHTNISQRRMKSHLTDKHRILVEKNV